MPARPHLSIPTPGSRRADGAHDGSFRGFSGVDQRPDTVQSGQRVERHLGAVEPFLPQAGPRPEAPQNGRYAKGGRIGWLGHLPFFSGCTTAKIVTDSLADKSRYCTHDSCQARV